VDAVASGFLSSMYTNALEKGVAQSVLGPQKKQLVGSVVRMYPQLAKNTAELQFG
jgi:ABC-type sulfate transport system substrate-binding protein